MQANGDNYVFGQPKNPACPPGGSKIRSEQECKDAASVVQKGDYQVSGTWGDTPTGCIYDQRGVFFNSNTGEGSGHGSLIPICKHEACAIDR